MIIVATLISENYSRKAVDLCDMVELRLDMLDKDMVEGFITAKSKKIIVTCRRKEDGGAFSGNEEKRLELLKNYVRHADLIDLEYDVRDEYFKMGRTIESFHSWRNPGYSFLKDLVEGKRGDIFKIAIYGKSNDDLKVIKKLHAEYDDIIAFLMGRDFSYTRILSALLSNPIIYCHTGIEAAEGQISVENAFEIRRLIGKLS